MTGPTPGSDPVSRRPKEFDDLLKRAGDLADEGFPEESAELLRDALSRFPGEPEHLLKAAIFGFESTPDEALSWLREAARLAGDDPNLLTRCASAFVTQRAFDDAERIIKATAALAPDGDFELEWSFIHTAGRLASQTGDYGLAEEYLTAAFQAEPEMPMFGERLALFLDYLDRPQEALEVLDEALWHSPQEEFLLRARREVEKGFDESSC